MEITVEISYYPLKKSKQESQITCKEKGKNFWSLIKSTGGRTSPHREVKQ